MSAPASDADIADGAFDALKIGRLTWIGLTVAAVGWALLIGEIAVVDILASKVPRPVPATFHADVVDIADCVIVSGFGIAMIGALQSGFGTLNRFFTTVLARSAQRVRVEASSPPTPVQEARPYRLLPDGSVEVETILGTRRFASMDEARDFI